MTKEIPQFSGETIVFIKKWYSVNYISIKKKKTEQNFDHYLKPCIKVN